MDYRLDPYYRHLFHLLLAPSSSQLPPIWYERIVRGIGPSLVVMLWWCTNVRKKCSAREGALSLHPPCGSLLKRSLRELLHLQTEICIFEDIQSLLCENISTILYSYMVLSLLSFTLLIFVQWFKKIDLGNQFLFLVLFFAAHIMLSTISQYFSQPLFKCLKPQEVKRVLVEVHEGICGKHIGERTLTFKVLRQGFY